MRGRNEALQSFVDAAFTAFNEFTQGPESRQSIQKLFSALDTPGTPALRAGSRLPACSNLDSALGVDAGHASLARLIDRFRQIEPSVEWRRRSSNKTASDNFVDGHANAMILGPGGLEQRTDIWLGATLLAPNVRYPDHDHSPEEVYLVLSEGEFRQGEGEWFSPGIGGSFYNVPNIKHAMRSLDKPLFAFWALCTDKAA
ncbi:Dimethlysulfonioproprionate lyase [Phyllobacterium sp. CL33Tsu]|uniref:dimethylsulfoniopropionate lyase n=1 Tax=Phyllobacterium sp. CL33Tsu TaxID=1798191 RepID=UPI0008E23BA1|nr:dimethylsulfoniopropionate lyase [Phyllobacterium sp. CL33Tsu]SFJ23078.1 Dimethlysulfonioproprionate lyase [Phyllobacterium sp. CL33Tsu]